jgi:sirohydrochlorin cobaltochelatase
VEPLVEQGPLLRASSAGRRLENAVQQALDGTDLSLCVVPITLGRDPQLVADTARTLRWLTRAVRLPGGSCWASRSATRLC